MGFWVTIFDDVFANRLRGEELDIDTLADQIRKEGAPTKGELPLLIMARLGGQRTPAGSLRNDANVISISGAAGDYDGEQCPVLEAVDRLTTAGIRAIVYTSPSYTSSKPRWRVLCPYSRELPPTEHARMTSRLNGILGGDLARESWTLSQSYYYGGCNGHAAEVYIVDEEQHLDEDPDLDETARPHRPHPGAPGAAPPDFDALDETALLELITSGQHYFRPAIRLIELWARAKMSEQDAEANLARAFDAVIVANRNRKWIKARANIGKWTRKVFGRVSKQVRAYLRALSSYLESVPPWQHTIRFNRFTQQIEVSELFPPHIGQISTSWRPMQDPEDVLEALMVIQESGFARAGKNIVRDALIIVARRHSYHPVTDWLDGLEWDGVERLKQLFVEYFPAALPADLIRRQEILEYLEGTATCFMVGAVARVQRPGTKVDCLPVLVGNQGWNKSQAIQALVPDVAWFSDDLSVVLVDRDTKESLAGKLLIELSEFPHIRREIEKVKAFFSRQSDRYREAYGRRSRDWPRQGVFIATCNELQFVDTSGNRRFWPIPLSAPTDVAAIARDRTQLWAEAMHWWHDGYKWWLSPDLEAIASEIQASFLEDDVWDGAIAAWIGGKSEVTVPEVLASCLGYALKPSDRSDNQPLASKADQMRVATCLKRLDWKRDDSRRRVGGQRHRFWVPR